MIGALMDCQSAAYCLYAQMEESGQKRHGLNFVMCDRLEPTQVIIVGKIPDELNTDVRIINFKTRNQKINEEMKE